MFDPALRIIFLGENPSWLKLSQAIANAPDVSLKVHRMPSLTEAFRALAAGPCDALAVDLHAWSIPGLRCIQKIRAEYPAVPIIALFYPSVKDLDTKALQAGASRCLPLDHFAAADLHGAIVSFISEKNSQSYLQKGSQMELRLNLPKGSSFPASKIQIISHALNNLLCVITANADVLVERFPVSDPAVHSLAEIKKAARSAADLMRHLT